MLAKITLMFMLLTFNCLASTPSTLSRDLFKADDIVRGLVTDIYTQADSSTVSIDVHYSLDYSKEELKVHFTKAKNWQIGEQVVLFVDKSQDRYKLRLGQLGKYVVRTLSGSEVLFNQGSTEDLYSRMDWSMLQKMVREHREDFFQVHRDRTVFNYKKGNRRPASVEDLEEESIPGSTTLWVALFFGMLGGLYTVTNKSKD